MLFHLPLWNCLNLSTRAITQWATYSGFIFQSVIVKFSLQSCRWSCMRDRLSSAMQWPDRIWYLGLSYGISMSYVCCCYQNIQASLEQLSNNPQFWQLLKTISWAFKIQNLTKIKKNQLLSTKVEEGWCCVSFVRKI
jgi:predicted membrane channel-forming protein YqfA (hemolysin III family)